MCVCLCLFVCVSYNYQAYITQLCEKNEMKMILENFHELEQYSTFLAQVYLTGRGGSERNTKAEKERDRLHI